jgi:hypothetical protein
LIGAITVAVSCREPTQVTVRITTGEKCADMSSVQTVVGPSPPVTQQRFEGRVTTAASEACDATGLVGTLVITPGGESGSVLVAAGVRVGDVPPPDGATCADPETAKRCIIARRRFSFIDHESLTLPIHLDRLCVGKTCDPASTCFKGTCVDSNVTCNGSECGLPQEHPGEGDGGPSGSSDGAYDAELDGPGFEDADFDAPDGTAVVDGGPDTDGSINPVAPSCGDAGGPEFCHHPSGKGMTTAGPCPGGAGNFCCRCTCGSSVVKTCEPTSFSGSCNPMCL